MKYGRNTKEIQINVNKNPWMQHLIKVRPVIVYLEHPSAVL